MKTLSFALLMSLAFSPFALARYPKGKVFTVAKNQTSFSTDNTKYMCERAAASLCASGRAQRISAWRSVQKTLNTYPGNCYELDGQNVCDSDTTWYYYSSSARFRCQ